MQDISHVVMEVSPFQSLRLLIQCFLKIA